MNPAVLISLKGTSLLAETPRAFLLSPLFSYLQGKGGGAHDVSSGRMSVKLELHLSARTQ